MNIGLIDADLLDRGTNHPNLALLKLSGYHKNLGHDVKLITDYEQNFSIYDKVYASKVFTNTKFPTDIKSLPNVEIGGTGFFADGGKSMPYAIEHHMPDYSLYDGIVSKKKKDYYNYSIGFMTRGCFRKCDFCINKKYDKVERHASVKEFLDDKRKYIYLWDDNILGYSKWYEVFDELEKTGKRFQFRQGLDIRLATKENLTRLANANYHGDVIFAFDDIKNKEIITRGLKIWNSVSHKTPKIYVLCGYDTNNQYDDKFFVSDIVTAFERVRILMKHNALPYITRYGNLDTGFHPYNNSIHKGIYITLARWANQPSFIKKISFRKFCEKNDEYTKKTCAPMRYLQKFESEHPDIAREYFDMKWSDFQ